MAAASSAEPATSAVRAIRTQKPSDTTSAMATKNAALPVVWPDGQRAVRLSGVLADDQRGGGATEQPHRQQTTPSRRHVAARPGTAGSLTASRSARLMVR